MADTVTINKELADGTCMTQAQYAHSLVIDRCVIALHDFGSREGATRAKVMSQLKAEGFTANEISEAVSKIAQ